MAMGVCAFATGCNDTIENGSKIEKCTVTFNVDGKDEAINFKLYMNIAPNTIAHFKYLAGKGYYNDSAVSDVNSAVEFGAFASDWTSLDGKYAEIINKDYVSTLKGEVYTSRFTLCGEMEDFGVKYEGPSLDLTDGALVLKRDLNPIKADGSNERIESYDTGKGVVAVTFTTDSYFSKSGAFAIFGKADKSDASGDVKSSYSRMKSILDDYKKDEADNKYYYFSYITDADNADEIVNLDKAIEQYGREYMIDDDGVYYYKDASGAYVKISTDDELGEIYVNAVKEKAAYVSLRPAKKITIKSVEFSK